MPGESAGVRRLLRRARIPSTQDLARREADDGAPAGTLVVAGRQTRGRGREGRRWSSGPGGVWFSLVLRPAWPPRRLAAFSGRVGDSLARALASASGLETSVKPPNDVLARAPGGPWKKVCGILIEAASGAGGGLEWVVVGVGINAANRLPRSLPHAATLSGLAGRPIPPGPVLRASVAAVLRAVKR